ncbi:MAG TPA: Gfo/Idh/MocA family oxidoreductase [Cytophagaceae bacterium]|jgi:predicted dehydrogenase|nr:Gfo/Idh/MocA family oxidoreductase [Cytophagaceae bacterium]
MNVLVVGGGSIGQRHIRNLHILGEYNIYCLRRNVDESFDKELGVTTVTSFAEAAKKNVEVVIVCTPTALHNESLKFAVLQNAAVFMEKPLIHDLEGLLEAKNLLKNSLQCFFIGFMLRFHPLVRKIKEIIDGCSLGNVYHARFEFGSFLPYWHPWEDHRTSYASIKKLGGGVINTITHELDLIQYFFGKPNALFCDAQNFNKLDIEVEEICEATFDYGDKLVSLHLDYLQKDYDRNIKILFDEGKVIWNWHDNKVIVVKHKEIVTEINLEHKFEVNQLYLDELTCFFELIGNKKNKHTLDQYHAFENTEIMLKMHQSIKEKSKIIL